MKPVWLLRKGVVPFHLAAEALSVLLTRQAGTRLINAEPGGSWTDRYVDNRGILDDDAILRFLLFMKAATTAKKNVSVMNHYALVRAFAARRLANERKQLLLRVGSLL